jgi:hypothetical protein
LSDLAACVRCLLVRKVGLLVATLQLDARLLIQAFDLGFCDAFMPAEIYEECEAAAKHAAAEKVRGRPHRQASACQPLVCQGRQQGAVEPAPAAATARAKRQLVPKGSSPTFAVGFVLQAAAQQGASGEPSTAPPAPTADQIREELVPLLLAAFAKRQKQQQRPPKGMEPAAPHNLAAITMLCMQAGYEDRAIDFMPALFAELPEQVCASLSEVRTQVLRHAVPLGDVRVSCRSLQALPNL